MQTLVISDLHLGNRAANDVLRSSAVLDRLLDALDGVGRLVLLGDTVELVTRNRRRSLAVAEPVLRTIGRRLGSDREVIVVPGNHDAPLVRRWALAQGVDLEPSTPVPPYASRALEWLLSWLAPARARVSYPGVWLGERVWATHGHYLNRHLIPESAFGILSRRVRGVNPAEVAPIEYERDRSRRRARQSTGARLRARPVGTILEGAAGILRRLGLPHLPRLIMNTGLAPVTAGLIDIQMRHQAMPAMAYVVRRLGVPADWVLFGHVHRRGPIRGEDWPAPGGTRFLNTGSWLYDRLLIDRAGAPHPYWPGGAILLDDGHEPRSLGLLDDFAAADLRPPLRAQR